MPQMSPIKWTYMLVLMIMFKYLFMIILNTTPMNYMIQMNKNYYKKFKWSFSW